MERYELSKDQVLAIVTDNARSMLKTVELLNDEEQESGEQESFDATQEEDAGDDDDDILALVVDS